MSEAFGGFLGNEEAAAGTGSKIANQADNGERKNDADQNPNQKTSFGTESIQEKDVDKQHGTNEQKSRNGFDAEHEKCSQKCTLSAREFTASIMGKKCKNAGLQLQKGQDKRRHYNNSQRGEHVHA